VSEDHTQKRRRVDKAGAPGKFRGLGEINEEFLRENSYTKESPSIMGIGTLDAVDADGDAGVTGRQDLGKVELDEAGADNLMKRIGREAEPQFVRTKISWPTYLRSCPAKNNLWLRATGRLT
jgi:hypothetical protein